MMRRFIVLSICLISVCAYAEPSDDVSELVEEFSMAMGIDQLLEATLQQTRVSLSSSMIDLSSGIKSKYPNLSESESTALDKLFVDYMDSILDSIDTEQASSIYAEIIAEGLPAEEIKSATEYYSSPDGQQLLKVVGVASAQLNQYILDQITLNSKAAQAKLSAGLELFLADISSK